MKRNQQHLFRLTILFLGILTASSALLGQVSRDPKTTLSVPTDWSHHHLIFSQPATAEQAKRVQQDPRYWQQLSRRAALLPPQSDGAHNSESKSSPNAPVRNGRRKLRRDWAEDMGSGATVGAGNFAAKFSFNITQANCATAPQPDFVVYSTGLLGTASQANIVAYDNLYSGCTGTVPTVYWAYNTLGTILNSPAFSLDGKQVLFVQTNAAGQASLVLLKWAASATDTIVAPTPLTRVLHADYPTCIAPCMTTTTLRNTDATAVNDTNSSVFYDYSGDAAYIGDDSGLLHKFTPVFNGALAQVTAGGWPAQLNPASPTPLGSPVHDYVSGNVFVSDTGGFLYRVNSTTAAVTTSGELDVSGLVEGPIVDSSSGFVYVFAASDGSGQCTGGTTDCAVVYQLTTAFVDGDPGANVVSVGASTASGTTPNPLYPGGFDSTYENSINATGNLYVCGNTGGTPILYQLAIQGSTLGTAIPGPALSTSTTPCSPVTDVLNPNATGGATEHIFASAQANGVSSACASGGCVMSFKDTPWLASTAYSLGQEVVDNVFHIQVVAQAGVSAGSEPTLWSGAAGGTTADGTVTWLNQGIASAVTPPAWAASHAYTKGQLILDTNNNIQVVFATTGTRLSGATHPTWSPTIGATVVDHLVTWKNVGVTASSALPAAGGTSGFIIDNTVGSGTLAGGSQIYFSTLSNQACGTSGTGGCAVQASQSALQ